MRRRRWCGRYCEARARLLAEVESRRQRFRALLEEQGFELDSLPNPAWCAGPPRGGHRGREGGGHGWRRGRRPWLLKMESFRHLQYLRASLRCNQPVILCARSEIASLFFHAQEGSRVPQGVDDKDLAAVGTYAVVVGWDAVGYRYKEQPPFIPSGALLPSV